jgi:NAD(P)-dependent dehydrogenase (short-subunit alcohol dehydrogenase family)
MKEPRVAVVTGANRGLGLETARQLGALGHRVILTARDEAKGQIATEGLRREGFDARFHPLEVTSGTGVSSLRDFLMREFGGLDVLVNNAALYLDEGISTLDVRLETWRQTFETNLFGPVALCHELVPIMVKRGWGRVVNVSSSAGQLSNMGDYAPSYSASKAALNALTRLVADAVRGSGVLVNAVCPGWVRTDMGGSGAPRSVQLGAKGIVWAAMLPDGGPTGGFFRDGKPLAW